MTTCLPISVPLQVFVPGSSRPPHTIELPLGGRSKVVAYFDCDGRFKSARLASMIKHFLRKRIREYTNRIPTLYNAKLTKGDVALDQIVTICLQRVFIFRPQDMAGLAASILRLPTFLDEMATVDSELALVVLDSLSAFHWQEAYLHSQSPQQPHSMRYIVTALARLRASYGPVVLVTTWALSTLPVSAQSKSSDLAYYRQSLAGPYPSPFSHAPDVTIIPPVLDRTDPLSSSEPKLPLAAHITIYEPTVPQFPVGTKLEEAIKDEKRAKALEVAVRVGLLRLPGCNDEKEVGRFLFRITEFGVETVAETRRYA